MYPIGTEISNEFVYITFVNHDNISTELAKQLGTSTSVIGCYGRDEMTPSIEAAKNLAKILNTTVGYLLGETEQENVFKNPDMLKRLNDIEDMDEEDRKHVLFTIDALIQKVKIKSITT